MTGLTLLDVATGLAIDSIPVGGQAFAVIYGTSFGPTTGSVNLCATLTGTCGSPGASIQQVAYWGQPSIGLWQVNALISAPSPVPGANIYVQVATIGLASLLLQSNRVPVSVASPCASVRIVEETVSPGSLPVRNPAMIRQGFAPVFEVTKSPASCGVQWSLTGPGTIIGSSNSTLVTVRGDSVGSISLVATGAGGLSSAISVPVAQQMNINIYGVIVRDSSGNNPAVSVEYMMADVDQANLVWQQAGVQFTLLPGGYIDDDQYLISSSQSNRANLRDWLSGTDGFEVYYLANCKDQRDLLGETSLTGIVICAETTQATPAAENTILAHELGHAQGLRHFCAGEPDPPEQYCNAGKTSISPSSN